MARKRGSRVELRAYDSKQLSLIRKANAIVPQIAARRIGNLRHCPLAARLITDGMGLPQARPSDEEDSCAAHRQGSNAKPLSALGCFRGQCDRLPVPHNYQSGTA